MNWYKISQEENLNGWITPDNKFLNLEGSHSRTLKNNNINLFPGEAINQGYIWTFFETYDDTLALEFDISRYQHAIIWGRRHANNNPKIKNLEFNTYKDGSRQRTFTEGVNDCETA